MEIKDKINKYLNEAKYKPKKGTPDYHELKIAIDTVKNPNKGLLSGPTEKESIDKLKKKFGYTDKEIEKLQK